MKRVFGIIAVMVFAFGMVACEAESTASQEELFIDSPDNTNGPDDKRD
ncbi:hypothetical protein ABV409_09850 [Flagellimonas sp. DF-77]